MLRKVPLETPRVASPRRRFGREARGGCGRRKLSWCFSPRPEGFAMVDVPELVPESMTHPCPPVMPWAEAPRLLLYHGQDSSVIRDSIKIMI